MRVRRDRTPWAGARWAGLAFLSVALAGAASSPGVPGGTDGGSSGSDGGGGGSDSGIPQQPCGPMDVAFVIDVTGSMGGAINNVKAAIPQLMDQIVAASASTYRTIGPSTRAGTGGSYTGPHATGFRSCGSARR